jgi:tyrosine-protein phosphatase YwqE
MVVVMAFILYLIDDGCNQATKTKLMYRTLLACLRNIVNFWSKMTIKYNNEINAELKITEKVTAFLKIEEAAKRDSSNGQLNQLQRRCQFF